MTGRGFEPGDSVRLIEATTGFKQGPSAEHGDGQPGEIPSGAVCEVWDVEASTGWVTVHFDLDDSRAREPYRISAIVEASKLEPVDRPAPPDIGQWFPPQPD